MKSSRKLALMGLALLSAAALGAGVAAAEHAEGQEHSHDDGAPLYRIVQMLQVHPSKMREHEANSREWVKAFREAKMGDDWQWWTSVGPQFTYVYVIPFGSFADLDREEERNQEMMEALGAEKVEELMAGMATVRSYRQEIVKLEPELSYMTPPTGPPGFLRVGVHWVEPSMDKEYRELMKKVVAAFEKTEQPGSLEVHRVAFGDGSYVVVTTAPSASAFYERPDVPAVLAEAYGQEEAGKLVGEWLSCVTNFDTENYRIRPDLSYIPAMYAEEGEGEMMEGDSEGE